MSKVNPIAGHYANILGKVCKKEKLYIVLGDGNVYRAVYKWKNDPEDGDVIGFFIKNEFRIGYITESDWEQGFHDWFFTTINILPFIGRVQNKSVVSRQPSYVPLSSVQCIFRKVKKAKTKGTS